MLCLAENARMRAIARRFHSMLTLVDGEASSRIALERADPWSFFEEAMEAGEALVAAAVELGAAWPGFVSGIDGRRSAA